MGQQAPVLATNCSHKLQQIGRDVPIAYLPRESGLAHPLATACGIVQVARPHACNHEVAVGALPAPVAGCGVVVGAAVDARAVSRGGRSGVGLCDAVAA